MIRYQREIEPNEPVAMVSEAGCGNRRDFVAEVILQERLRIPVLLQT